MSRSNGGSGGKTDRSRLLSEYTWLVETAAWSLCLHNASLSFEDIYQDGFVGLIEAAERFDPRRGVPFAAYARRRVIGSMLTGIRRIDGVACRELTCEPSVEPEWRDPMLLGRIERVLSRLPLVDGLVCDLVMFGGLSYRRTSRAVGICLSSVQASLRRGLRELRAEFSPCG
jgi:RNA polymerase sigma factor (sigma-70 family)